MTILLETKNLAVDYVSSKLGIKTLTRAVDNLSFNVQKGEIFAIAGESGCGKSTLAKTLIKLIEPTSGDIIYNGQNILNLDKKQIKNFRQQVQMIFQNPYASLNPKMTIKQILEEPLKINTKLSSKEIDKIVKEKLSQVELDESFLSRYPHEFSGGQRQRIAISRALMLNPELILADEPVSALDASIQAQIINLINDLKKQYNMTMIFISHDLNVIRYIADRIGIMYLGELVETGTCDEIFENPMHPYTKLLLNSIPDINKKPQKADLSELPVEIPKGCRFFTRCKSQNCNCSENKPHYIEISPTHKYLCVNQ